MACTCRSICAATSAVGGVYMQGVEHSREVIRRGAETEPDRPVGTDDLEQDTEHVEPRHGGRIGQVGSLSAQWRVRKGLQNSHTSMMQMIQIAKASHQRSKANCRRKLCGH